MVPLKLLLTPDEACKCFYFVRPVKVSRAAAPSLATEFCPLAAYSITVKLPEPSDTRAAFWDFSPTHWNKDCPPFAKRKTRSSCWRERSAEPAPDCWCPAGASPGWQQPGHPSWPRVALVPVPSRWAGRAAVSHWNFVRVTVRSSTAGSPAAPGLDWCFGSWWGTQQTRIQVPVYGNELFKYLWGCGLQWPCTSAATCKTEITSLTHQKAARNVDHEVLACCLLGLLLCTPDRQQQCLQSRVSPHPMFAHWA